MNVSDDLNVSKTNQDKLSMLNGCECWSLNYEGCVFINRNDVILDGIKVDTLNSNSKISQLWTEYVEGEGF